MKNTNGNEHLGERIEQLIREHLVAEARRAQEAVARAFAVAANTSASTNAPRRARRTPGKKRASADIAALGDRFYRAVCTTPGETMTVLAAGVGASARELHRSVTLLKRAGRVRAVGKRHSTRYFPMADGAAT